LSSLPPGESTETLNASIAYQLGMMVVSGAAKMVNNVTDGAKHAKDTDELQKLRELLDNQQGQYEALQLEYGNAKVELR